MNNILVIDLETRESFAEIGSRNPEKLRLSLLGAYFYPKKKYFSFRENELMNFWPILDRAKLLIGHNILGFDLPVLKKYFNRDFSNKKVFDIMYEAEEKIGFKLKLNDIAKATLGEEKSGDGLQAIELFREGNWKKLKDYCLRDVRLTKEIFDYIMDRGFIYYPGMLGKEKIKMDNPFLMRIK